MKNVLKLLVPIVLLAILTGCTAAQGMRKLAQSEAVLDQPAVTVTFTPVNGAIVLPVRLNDSKEPLNFLLHSGTLNAISPETAASHHLEMPFHVIAKKVSGKIEDAPIAIADRLWVAGASIRNAGLAVYEMDVIEQRVGIKVDGLLGNNFLRLFETTIDYQNNRIILQNPYATKIESIVPGPDTYVLPFKISLKEGFTPKIAGKINGSVRASFTIDTGNLGFTFLTHDTAVYLGYLDQPTSLHVGQLDGEPIGGYTGLYQQPMIGRLERLDFGVLNIGPHLFTSAQGDNNSIGYGVLKNFRVTLNYEKRIVVFKQWQDSPVQSKSTCWLAIGRKKDKYIITGLVRGSEAQRAGLAPFDEVLEVNGKKASELGLLKIQEILLDDRIDTVELTIGGKPAPIRLKKADLLNLKACILPSSGPSDEQ